MFLLLLLGLCFVFLMIHLGIEECMIWVLWLLLVSISQFGYPIYLHLASGRVVVDNELFYQDTFSAHPVYVSVLLENLGVETLAIRFDLKIRFFKSSAGLGRLWLIGVFRKHSIANLGSLPACFALISLLIVWSCLSIKPFDFWKFSDDVMWSNCHCWANSLIASLNYCGPLSLIIPLGIPCSENTCFMTILHVFRSFIFCIIGNLL